MKKLMILGASYSQLPLYEAAKKLGLQTVAASIPGNWPGFSVADEAAYVDISDVEATVKAAKEHQIDGVATCCFDTGMAAIGAVCEELGLCGPSRDAAWKASNKLAMKEAFVRGGVCTARHMRIRNREELEAALEQLSFPVVVKAVDLMGSRGIYRSATKEEALANFEKTMSETKKDYCLVEEFIQGKLFGAEAMVKDGELLYCAIYNSHVYQSHVPTSIGHSVPFEDGEELEQEAIRQVKKAVQATGLNNCPVDCDLIHKDGKVYVIEITGRAGATCLPETIGNYYGINYYEAIARMAMDMDVERLFQEKRECCPTAALMLTSQRGGIVKEIHNRNGQEEYLVDLAFNIGPGDEVRRYTNGRDRLGQVIVRGRDLSGCKKHLEEVLSKINIEFEP